MAVSGRMDKEVAYECLRNSLSAESVVQTLGIGTRGGLSLLLTISCSPQGFDFCPDIFLSNRFQWQGWTLRPTVPRAPQDRESLTKGECPHPSQRQEGGSMGEEMGPGNRSILLRPAWPRWNKRLSQGHLLWLEVYEDPMPT